MGSKALAKRFQKHLQRTHVSAINPSFATQQALFPEAKYICLKAETSFVSGNNAFHMEKPGNTE